MAVKKAEALRGSGSIIQLVRKSSKIQAEEYKEYAKRMGIERVVYLKSEDETEDWRIK